MLFDYIKLKLIIKIYTGMLHTSNNIRNPGLRTLLPGVERYFVNGGGLSLIELSPEDKIEIINDEGRQICEKLFSIQKVNLI